MAVGWTIDQCCQGLGCYEVFPWLRGAPRKAGARDERRLWHQKKPGCGRLCWRLSSRLFRVSLFTPFGGQHSTGRHSPHSASRLFLECLATRLIGGASRRALTTLDGSTIRIWGGVGGSVALLESPLTFGAKNWVVYFVFENGVVAAVLVRTNDWRHESQLGRRKIAARDARTSSAGRVHIKLSAFRYARPNPSHGRFASAGRSNSTCSESRPSPQTGAAASSSGRQPPSCR